MRIYLSTFNWLDCSKIDHVAILFASFASPFPSKHFILSSPALPILSHELREKGWGHRYASWFAAWLMPITKTRPFPPLPLTRAKHWCRLIREQLTRSRGLYPHILLPRLLTFYAHRSAKSDLAKKSIAFLFVLKFAHVHTLTCPCCLSYDRQKLCEPPITPRRVWSFLPPGQDHRPAGGTRLQRKPIESAKMSFAIDKDRLFAISGRALRYKRGDRVIL